MLILGLLWAGIASLTQSSPVSSRWVAVKLLVYAALLVVGLYLRISIRGWRQGFAALRAGQAGPEIDALLVEGRRKARYGAFLFWALIIFMAWLGISQPF